MIPLFTGSKGSEKPHTPVEAPDSIRSVARAKMLLALGEGEFAGGITGRDIYLDGTPLIAESGTENFPGVRWEFRPGTPHQSYIQGMPNVQNEIAVAVALPSDTPWVRAVSNTQLSAVRIRVSWPLLVRTKDNGDRVGTRVDYAIDLSTDGGAWETVLDGRINDKTTTKYERSHRIDLPPATSGWQVRVRRLTPDSTSSDVINAMRVEAITEVIDAKLRYPNTALLFIEFDASQFQQIPQVSVDCKMRVVRVPTNYDPESRTYSGLWDGTFKWAWTNNPAWVCYDVLRAERFGLGRRLTAANVDKWALYQIAQYCDERVPDGRGGQEPRFTCDIYIQEAAQAWNVLRDLTAIYRGMLYWADSQMVSMADMPRDIDYVYTRANVVDGHFEYGSSNQRERYSTALVSWDNPDNDYQSDVVAVSDQALVRRYGINQLELTAIGCTRQSEAHRRGKWALLTNSKDRTVDFRVGLDGHIPLPGRIIGVADELLAGRPLGGRIHSATDTQVTLDRPAQMNPGDRLIVNLPSGAAEARTVQAASGAVVTVTTAYSETPVAQAVWSVDADDLAVQQFRVIGRAQVEEGLFQITAVQHDPGKYQNVDTGARIDNPPISVIPPSAQPAPTGVTIDSYSQVDQGIAITTMRAQWEPAAGAIAYQAEWRKDDGPWVNVPRTSALGFEVSGIYAGNYLVRVRAINALDVQSLPASSMETTLNGKIGDPPALASLTATGLVFGIKLEWGFPETGAADALKVELEYGEANDVEQLIPLGDFPYPQRNHTLTGLSAGKEFWFRARIVDRSGNIGPWTSLVHGVASASAGPILEYLNGQITETQLSTELLDLIDEAGGSSVVVQQLINELAAMYTIKAQLTVDGVPYLAGVGVGIENNDGVITSQVLVAASRFAVVDPNTDEVISPFVIQGGQAIINEAIIGSASIGSAKLADWLESDAVGPGGEPVFRLNMRTGAIAINAALAGGGRMSITNDAIKVFDESDVLRVQMGDLSA